MIRYSRPSIIEINHVLRTRNGLVVHFSGCPKGHGTARSNNLYPNDLRTVAAYQTMGGLSCSVVMPGDEFHTFQTNNAFGTIGMILGFRSPDSILDVSATDCGSSDINGVRLARQSDITVTELEQSIDGRPSGRYNEWVVGQYIVLGIFVAPPVSVFEIRDATSFGESEYVGTGPIDAEREESIADVMRNFPNTRIFAFRTDSIVECKDSQWMQVQHSDVYSA